MVANWSLQATKSRRRKKEGYFLKNLSVALNNYLSKNEHIILFGDFKLSNTNKHFAVLMAFLSPAIRDKNHSFLKRVLINSKILNFIYLDASTIKIIY